MSENSKSGKIKGSEEESAHGNVAGDGRDVEEGQLDDLIAVAQAVEQETIIWMKTS